MKIYTNVSALNLIEIGTLNNFSLDPVVINYLIVSSILGNGDRN